MSTVIDKINNLPFELIDLIKEYIPKQKLAFTNKSNYLLYHKLIKSTIKNYENFDVNQFTEPTLSCFL